MKMIFTTILFTLSAASSLAATKCDHKGQGSLFAHTNPPVAATKVAQTSQAASSQVGTR